MRITVQEAQILYGLVASEVFRLDRQIQQMRSLGQTNLVVSLKVTHKPVKALLDKLAFMLEKVP